MKNLYLFTFSLIISINVSAQKFSEQIISHEYISGNINTEVKSMKSVVDNVIWSSDFSDPTDWVFDNDGESDAGYGWSIVDSPIGWWSSNGISSSSGGNYAELSNGVPQEGSQATGIIYTMTTAVSINIFDSIGVNGSASLSFEEFGAKFYDLQEVQISLDGDTYITVANNLENTMLTTNGGSAYDNPTLRVINLAPFLNSTPETVWIRFSWTSELDLPSTDPYYANTWITYGWYVDDVKIIKSPQFAMNIHETNYGGWFSTPISEGWGLDYSFIPESQLANNPYTFEGIISNEGSDTLIDVLLSTIVLDENNNEIDLLNSSTTNINPLQLGDSLTAARDTLVTVEYTPTNTGKYHFQTFGSTQDAITDTAYSWSVVTNNEYGRDFDEEGSGRWYLTRETGSIEVGNVFDIYSDETIYGIKAFIHPAYSQAGPQVYGIIYEKNTQGGNTYLVQTANTTITDSNQGWLELYFNDPTPLFAGTQYVFCIGGVGNGQDTVAIATSGEHQDGTSSMYDLDGIYGNGVTWYNATGGTPMVRALMGENPNVSISEESASAFKITPNPSNGIISLKSDNTIKLVIIKDALGRMVYESKSQFSSIDLSYLEKGPYFVSIMEDGGKRKTKKLIIQ